MTVPTDKQGLQLFRMARLWLQGMVKTCETGCCPIAAPSENERHCRISSKLRLFGHHVHQLAVELPHSGVDRNGGLELHFVEADF